MEGSQFVCHFLLHGEKDSEDAKTISIPVDKTIIDQLKIYTQIFGKLVLGRPSEDGASEVYLDVRDVPDFNEDDARLLSDFILKYEPVTDKQAKVFTKVSQFNRFKEFASKLNLLDEQQLKVLQKDVFTQHPILLLQDIGGSILFRCGDRLNIPKKVDYQVKRHYHYSRPFADDFLKALMDHPRAKVSVYTSIMRKNVMPLLFKLFDTQKLRDHRKDLFDVFDQEYNVPDPGQKEHYATKRRLELVFDNEKVEKAGFNFTNTIMVDSDSVKVRDYKENSIVVPPYTEEEVKNPTEDQNKILMNVRDYIYKLLDEADDIQEYIRNHPQTFISEKEQVKEAVNQKEEQKEQVDELSKILEQKLVINENNE